MSDRRRIVIEYLAKRVVDLVLAGKAEEAKYTYRAEISVMNDVEKEEMERQLLNQLSERGYSDRIPSWR